MQDNCKFVMVLPIDGSVWLGCEKHLVGASRVGAWLANSCFKHIMLSALDNCYASCPALISRVSHQDCVQCTSCKACILSPSRGVDLDPRRGDDNEQFDETAVSVPHQPYQEPIMRRGMIITLV